MKWGGIVDEVAATYLWLINHHGVAASKIFLCGDSAGGNLALSLLWKFVPAALMAANPALSFQKYLLHPLRHRNLPKPRGIVAISPALELNGDLRPKSSKDPMLPSWLVSTFHEFYGMTREELTEASIYYEPDLSFLPDTFVMVSNTELLFEETVRFAKKFARLPITLKVYPQWPHAGTMWSVCLKVPPPFFEFSYCDFGLYLQLPVHARELGRARGYRQMGWGQIHPNLGRGPNTNLISPDSQALSLRVQ